jgi:hypothetical protein
MRKVDKEGKLKKFLLLLILSVMIFASCSLLSMFNPFKSGHIVVYIKSGENAYDFDFDSKGEVERTGVIGSDIDILLEPWVDMEGNPIPTIMLNIVSPDSFSFIMDLGIISLDDATALEDSDLVPVSLAMDFSAKKDHC